MNIINPPSSTQTTSGLDVVITQVGEALITIPWITVFHGRAWLIPEKKDNVITRTPKIYQGSQEYFPTMMNDSITAASYCMGVDDSETSEITAGNQTPAFFSKRLDIVVHGRLDKVDSGRDEYFVEELANEVLTSLKNTRVQITNVVFEDIRNVFDGVDINEINRDQLIYPWFGIRIQTIASYLNELVICP